MNYSGILKVMSLLTGIIVVGILLGVLIILTGCATPLPTDTKLVKRACADTEILTYTNEEWSSTDQQAYDTATRRCSELYPRSPCVRKFIRYAQLRYGVICGHSPDAELQFMVSP